MNTFKQQGGDEAVPAGQREGLDGDADGEQGGPGQLPDGGGDRGAPVRERAVRGTPGAGARGALRGRGAGGAEGQAAREAKIAELKEKVESGDFKPSSNDVASAVIRELNI